MDTSKHIFQLHGVNAAEQPVLRKKLRRKEIFEMDGKNWTGFGSDLRCGIAPRMVKNQGDRNGEHTKETQRGV
jgi:hypothetical protein